MNFGEILHQVGGSVVTILTSSALVGGVLSLCAKPFVDHRFSKLLQTEQTKQNLQLESGKAELGKSSKIYDKELEILPTAWAKMHAACGAVRDLTAPLQEYADIGRLNDDELRAELAKMGFGVSVQNDVFRIPPGVGRQKEYSKLMRFFKRRRAETEQISFNNYILENAIFMEKPIWELFQSINATINNALISFGVGMQVNEQGGEHRDGIELQIEADKAVQAAYQSVDALLPMIQSRLQSRQTQPTPVAGTPQDREGDLRRA